MSAQNYSGTRWCVMGAFKGVATKEVEAQLKALGATCVPSPVKGTFALIGCNGGSNAKKARKLNLPTYGLELIDGSYHLLYEPAHVALDRGAFMTITELEEMPE